ncbi:MAG: DUF4214 domain-containing protein [Clostridiales bacterium]|nr:DUF4214 domain-containing protein [Clostridiales bacterium]
MKKAKTSIGRKLLGSFVTMALVFGMLPGMLTTADVEEAPSTDGVVQVNVTPSSNVTASAPATIGGITLSVPSGQSEGISMPDGLYNGKRFQVALGNTSKFNFSINEEAGFASGRIVKIEIAVSSVTGISSHGGTEGWDEDLAAGTFTWAGDAAQSVELSFTGNLNIFAAHRVAFTAITVYVEVPVTSVAITGVPAGPVAVGQTVELGIQVEPSNTTYSSFDIECSDNASFELIVDEGVATIKVTIEAEGSVSISASLGGVSGEGYILAYQPVDSVGIAPESLELTTEDDPATVIVYTAPETDVYDVEWSIGNESVATIDVAEDALSAVVTPVGVGETTITAVFYSVEYEDGLELTCAVSVTEPEPEPGPEPAPEEPALTPEQIQRMAVEHFVERLYVEALGRQFDKNGRDAWADILMAGGSASAVARGFFGSQEFLNRNLTNEEFVTILYKVFYDSVPETGSYTNYVDALYNGMMTRSEVIDSFASSYEWASFCARYAVNV